MTIYEQIEEMAKALTSYEYKLCERLPKDKCLLTSAIHSQVSCDYCKIAEFLVNNGYRKQSDVAREIDDLRRYIIINEDIALKCKQENGEKNEEYWKGNLSAFKQIRAYIDAELKKKYTGDGK